MTLARTPTANRGPIEYSSLASPVPFNTDTNPPIAWIQVITAGSGGLVVKDEAGTARTYTGLNAERVLVGPFSELTSMTCSKIMVGDGPPPVPMASLAAAGVPVMQAVTATLASGTITISTGIIVAANSEVIAYPRGAITGSTNFGCVRELVASRVAGVAGVGTVVIEAVGADGAKDTDAAGAIRVVILTPQ